MPENFYDAIVVGSGISGGWAAKELCEQGLKTLVLERCSMVEHLKDYPTTTMDPWQFKHRGVIDEIKKENPVVGRCYAFEEATQHFFVKDKEHPYVQEKPFDWIRGYQVGGKSLIWARQTHVGANMISRALQEMALRLTGQSGMMTLHHGTVMWNVLRELAEIMTV